MIDPATSLLLADAVRRARQAGPSELGLAETDLTRALRATFAEPGFRTELDENEGASELVGEVEAASHQVFLARKFYNDLAGRTHRRPPAPAGPGAAPVRHAPGSPSSSTSTTP